jgi:hypothetical protein
MSIKLARFVLVTSIITVPGLSQTASELLEKGVFAQETEGAWQHFFGVTSHLRQ